MSTHPDDSSATDLKHLRVIAKTEVKPCLEEVLAGTIELQKADLGCVHLCNPDTKWPEMVADRGLSRDFIGHFLRTAMTNARSGAVPWCDASASSWKTFGPMRVSPATVPLPMAVIARFNPHPCSAATAYRSAPSQHSFESLMFGQIRSFASAISTPRLP